MLGAYSLHSYLKLNNAPRVFNILDSTTLHCPLVAFTMQKAKELLYDKISVYLRNSPWYKSFHECLDHYGNKYGEELYKLRDTFAHYRYNKMFMYPVGADQAKLRGNTSAFGIIDELGWMNFDERAKKNRNAAQGVYTSVKNSFRTLRSAYYRLLRQGYDGLPSPLLCEISSPSSRKDMICQIYELSKTSKFIYGVHAATWEVNPEIEKEDLEDEFNTNYSNAMRDFGAVPPNSSNPYISDIDDIRPAIDRKRLNYYYVIPKLEYTQSGKEMRSGKLRFQRALNKNHRILALDCGYSNNSFAFATGFYDEENSNPIIDGVGEIQPTDQCPINFTFVYEDIICPIIEKMNIQMVICDRWQNLKLLHDIEEQYGIMTEQYSVKYGDFNGFRECILNGELTIPKPEMKPSQVERAGEEEYPSGFLKAPVAHLLYQMITVSDLGKDVIKGEGSTDDILRASVLLFSYITDPEYREYCTGIDEDAVEEIGIRRPIASIISRGVGSRVNFMNPLQSNTPYINQINNNNSNIAIAIGSPRMRGWQR